MIWLFIYLVGCVVANYLLFRMYNKYMYDHPEEKCENYQWGYWVVGVLMSWITVFALIFGSLASYNQLEWDEEEIEFTQEEIDEYMAHPELRESVEVSEEKTKKEAIKILHEMELKKAQEEAVRNSRDF